MRLHVGDLPILWEEGSYNPDFLGIAEDATHWVIEVKSDRDLKSDEVSKTLEESMKLAEALGLNGTPSYVIGNDVVIGAVGQAQLSQKIQAARQQ